MSAKTVTIEELVKDYNDHQKVIVQDESALDLWKRLFDWTDYPYESWGDGLYEYCFFCGESENSPHAVDCIWVKAKKLVEQKND